MARASSELTTAVIVGQSKPMLHGQAVAVANLLEEASSWKRIRLLHVNAEYAVDRAKLRKYEFKKVLRAFLYLTIVLKMIYRDGASIIVATVSFDRGPFLKDAFLILAVRALSKARVIGWVHMDPARLAYEQTPWWFSAIVRNVVSRVHIWVACAPSLLNKWPTFLPPQRRQAILNGIAAPIVQRSERPANTLRVTYLSAMERLKGWEDLLAAATSVCASRNDVEVYFYGAPAGDATLESVTSAFSRLEKPNRIRWLGPVYGNSKWQALADTDLFCFPSHSEQFPITILEAMAVGLPVVASRVGAVEDAIVPGKGGWLVEKQSPTALACALSTAIGDVKNLRSFGAFNRERFEQNFARSVFGEKWQELLCHVARDSQQNGPC
jgi:glycosyltransferase involved in cell wall biosynthesis